MRWNLAAGGEGRSWTYKGDVGNGILLVVEDGVEPDVAGEAVVGALGRAVAFLARVGDEDHFRGHVCCVKLLE